MVYFSTQFNHKMYTFSESMCMQCILNACCCCFFTLVKQDHQLWIFFYFKKIKSRRHNKILVSFMECSSFLMYVFSFISLYFIKTDIIPTVNTDAATKEFLLKVVDILLDYVRTQNDRNERILEFHHPEDMKQLLDLDLPETALPLQQLIQDCARTMKYQVRTGEYNFFFCRNNQTVKLVKLVKFNSMNEEEKKIVRKIRREN